MHFSPAHPREAARSEARALVIQRNGNSAALPRPRPQDLERRSPRPEMDEKLPRLHRRSDGGPAAALGGLRPISAKTRYQTRTHLPRRFAAAGTRIQHGRNFRRLRLGPHRPADGQAEGAVGHGRFFLRQAQHCRSRRRAFKSFDRAARGLFSSFTPRDPGRAPFALGRRSNKGRVQGGVEDVLDARMCAHFRPATTLFRRYGFRTDGLCVAEVASNALLS
mmetsp:Transcript_20189/g.71814  ORF Transcript_20189/g.71814 Transcript_20189/m.71814 type:complete len:221 (+) Transcript_20189:956-1618(+)